MLSRTVNYLPSTFAIVAMLLISACQTPTSAVESGSKKAKSQQNAEVAKVEATAEANKAKQAGNDPLGDAKVVRKKGEIANRGVYIKILVNKTPITNLDLRRRKKLLELQRAKGNRTKLAESSLIEQTLKLQEAKRVKTLASDQQVNEAFANFARGNRTSVANMSKQLARFGVGTDHFKDFIRGQMSWRRTVQKRFQLQTQNLSESEAIKKARESGDANPIVTEYGFKQIVFVVPKNKRSKARLNERKADAKRFRASFTNCEGALALAKQYKDVSVLTRSRVLEPQLPVVWVEGIKTTDAKGVTNPLETEKGVEMLAVCTSKQVSDDRATKVVTQSKEFENFDEKGKELSEKYLGELKARSTIVYQ